MILKAMMYNDIPDPEHTIGLISSLVFKTQDNDYTYIEGSYGKKDIKGRISAMQYASSNLAESYIIQLNSQIVGDIFLPPICPRGLKMNPKYLICEEAKESVTDMRSLELGKFAVILPYSAVSISGSFQQSYSMIFWLKIYSGSGTSCIVITQPSAVNKFELIFNAVSLSFTLYPMRGSDLATISGTGVSTNTWMHFAIVNNGRKINNGKLKILFNVNESPAAQVGASSGIPSNDISLFGPPSNILFGKMREFSIWDFPLEFAIINKFAYRQISKSFIDMGKVIMLYRLNEGEGNSLKDQSIGGISRTISLSIGSLKEHEIWTSDNDLIICSPHKIYASNPGSCKSIIYI